MHEHKRPLILVSNDDGITSLGICKLVELMRDLGRVVVVAPKDPQSGQGHAVTMGELLRLEPSDIFGDVEAYSCSGRPADCVKMAKHHVLKEERADLVVSGINHGSNVSIHVLYSGTMAAALEGAMEGIPSIGFSLCDDSRKAPMSHLDASVQTIAKQVLSKKLPSGIALNVNIPPQQETPLRGFRVCRQAQARWKEHFHVRMDPRGRRYFWMEGAFVPKDTNKEDDTWAIEHNYVSIVPCTHDLTDYRSMQALKAWDW